MKLVKLSDSQLVTLLLAIDNYLQECYSAEQRRQLEAIDRQIRRVREGNRKVEKP